MVGIWLSLKQKSDGLWTNTEFSRGNAGSDPDANFLTEAQIGAQPVEASHSVRQVVKRRGLQSLVVSWGCSYFSQQKISPKL